ncbi:MAG: hypothetical protein H7329_14095 [Opitutaceae bacterium]|nr:hypothetical protein [Cytophagales bacterium]
MIAKGKNDYKVDSTLDHKYDGKILFPEKVEKATQFVKKLQQSKTK